jgi:hypothetical protein
MTRLWIRSKDRCRREEVIDRANGSQVEGKAGEAGEAGEAGADDLERGGHALHIISFSTSQT